MSSFALGIVVGLSCYDALVRLAIRIALKIPSAKIRDLAREFARERGLEPQEKGRVVSLRNSLRKDALKEGVALTDALDQDTDDGSE